MDESNAIRLLESAEVAEKLATEIRKANAALSQMHDKGARWWSFGVSHQNFEMVVGDPLGSDNVVLALSPCDYLCGPTNWSNQQLEVAGRCIDGAYHWEFTLQDMSAGFRATGGLFR